MSPRLSHLAALGLDGSVLPHTSYLRHLGIYLYSPLFLASYAKLPISELEEQEDLEQLRVLSAGYRIKVLRVGEHAGIAVDTPGQLSFLKSQWPGA